MEAVEFYIIDGQVRYRHDGSDKELVPADPAIISLVLDNVRRLFPDTYRRLSEMHSRSERNRRYYDFLRAERFIRCNFGKFDKLTMDISNGTFHLEEVECPLRGICKDEGVICRPVVKLNMTRAEQEVAELYSRGCLPDEIAIRLRKSVSTVKNQLNRITRRLRLKRTRDLIKLFSLYPLQYIE